MTDLDAVFDRLKVAVMAGDNPQLADVLAPLSEAERRSLSKDVAQLWRDIENNDLDHPGWRLGPLHVTRDAGFTWEWQERGAAQLALLGACPPSTWKRVRTWFVADKTYDALRRILRDRDAPWRAGWLDEIADEEGFAINWEIARRLVRDGICDPPTEPSWVIAMSRALMPWQADKKPPIHEALLADPGLLEHDVWRLFDIDLGTFLWYPNRNRTDKQAPKIEGWGDALRRLADSGRLDRGRLLDQALDGLVSPLPASNHVAFRWLHDDLDPSLDEIAARESRYRLLLGARTGATAGFGLKALGRLERAGRLDREAFVADIGPIFEQRAKAHAERALKMLRRVLHDASTADAVRKQAIDQTIPALGHPAEDVVDAARAILAAHDPERLTAFDARASAFDPDPADDPEVEADALAHALERARAADVDWAPTLDADATLPPPWDPDPRRIRVLDRAEALPTIVDWQELVDVASQCVERAESADQIERLLDGLARLGGERPEGFHRRTEALVHRLDNPDLFDMEYARGTWMTMLWVIDCWLDRPWPKAPKRFDEGVDGFHSWRLHEIAQRLLSRRRDPLLATPTHVGGWIDPRTLVERLLALGSRDPDPADAIQALLRLAPDPPARAEALATSDALVDEPLRAPVRFALGGDDRPTTAWLDWRALAWIAAGRARDPRGSLDEALAGIGRAARGLLGGGPDALEAASYSWRATTVSQRYFLGPKQVYPHLDLQVDRDEEAPSDRPARVPWKPLAGRAASALARRVRRLALPFTEMPTSALHRLAEGAWEPLDLQRPWLVEWAARVWPSNPDPVLAAGIRWSMRRLDMSGSETSPNHVYLDTLLDPARPWTEIGYLAIGVALLSRDLELRGTALDALIDALDDGRAHPEPLGRTLAKLSDGGWAKPNRLADGLAEVARVSPWHQLAVVHLLDPLLGHWLADEPPHGALHLLKLTHEGLDAHGLALSASTRAVLAGLDSTGRSKTALALRALLDLEPRDEPRHDAARARAIEIALDRLESTDRGLAPAGETA